MSSDITSPRMPALFIGHGSPMNALEDNEFTRAWRTRATMIPRPTAILVISAHWQTHGIAVTAMAHPRTIHDFGGFPPALSSMTYPAPGSLALAETIRELLTETEVVLDTGYWGLDHGTWSILTHMYPGADIPVVQLSLDYHRDAHVHYDIARALAPLRDQGVLILGSGNIVHNFDYAQFDSTAIGHPPVDWAIEADRVLRELIMADDIEALTHYTTHSRALALAIPTPEHYLPLLYALAVRTEDDEIDFFATGMTLGSFSMTSMQVG